MRRNGSLLGVIAVGLSALALLVSVIGAVAPRGGYAWGYADPRDFGQQPQQAQPQQTQPQQTQPQSGEHGERGERGDGFNRGHGFGFFAPFRAVAALAAIGFGLWLLRRRATGRGPGGYPPISGGGPGYTPPSGPYTPPPSTPPTNNQTTLL